MGWSDGSTLMGALISNLVEEEVSFDQRLKIYTNMIEVFHHQDCDTLEECLGKDPAFDKARKPYIDSED